MTIAELQDQAIALLKQMINTPSYSREEETVSILFANYIKEQGYEVRRERNNVIVQTSIDPNKPTLLLNSHLDTVKPSASWTKDPHNAIIENDCLYGLGSNDAGASVVSLLMTFFKLTENEQAYNLVFLASAEEEISGPNGVEHALPTLPSIDFAIVGEPTGMQPAIAEKGLMVVDGIAKGKSGHAAREEGINAIYIAMKDIQWASAFQFPKVSEFLGPVKMSVTQVSAGEKHNVVPDECHFVMDIRPNELYSNEEVFDIISSNMKSELKARSYRLNSSLTDENHPFLAKAKTKGLKPYGSPTLSDQCLMRFSSIKMGPGDSARSHTADEYIKPQEIKDAIALYIELLDGLTF